MARQRRIPAYRRHKPSGLAVVRIRGKDFYLGKYDSPGRHREYERLIARWLAGRGQPDVPGQSLPQATAHAELTINELLLAYWGHAEGYYVKNGRPTGELANTRDAMRPLAALYGKTPVAEFGAPHLKTPDHCDEDPSFGYGLAPFVGQAWEAAHLEGLLPGMRSVILRTSFVLGRSGGALPRLEALCRRGLGGRAGHGRQGISWIHEGDMNRLFEEAITNERMRGAYIATAPNPVSDAEFMRALRRAVKVPIGLPAMTWMVRLGAPLVMHTDPELALYGRYCVSQRLAKEGFEFQFPDLASALGSLYRRDHR